MLEVVGVDVRDTLGDLGARHSAVEVEHLGSDLLEDIRAGLDAHQLIVELVSCADDLNIVKVVGIDGGETDTAIVHLTSEDFVAKEVVTENAAIGIG